MTQIMAILNLTPDSFSDGGEYLDPQKALDHALQLESEGADILDIGAESTRPGAIPTSAKEEIARLLPALPLILDKIKLPISLDTTKPEVAEVFLPMGVSILNDVNGLENPSMREVAAKHQPSVVVMHRHPLPGWEPCKDLLTYFEKQEIIARESGIHKLIFDPGFGFGKHRITNWKILDNLASIRLKNYPLLIGTSRKSFFDETKTYTTKETVRIGISRGADIVRVHDPKIVERKHKQS